MISTPATMSTIRTASGESESESTASIASRPSTKRPMKTAFATVPGPMRAPSAQASDEHAERDDDVRRAERQRRVLGDALVEHVPGREAELRLEEKHDPEGEQEQADARARPTARRRSRERGAARAPGQRTREARTQRSALSGGGPLLFRRLTPGTARTAATQT